MRLGKLHHQLVHPFDCAAALLGAPDVPPQKFHPPEAMDGAEAPTDELVSKFEYPEEPEDVAEPDGDAAE